jgi:excinuclease UvrABC helicase subunit UvrB
MYDHARALEFEQAAQLRDSISELKKRHFTASSMSDRPSVVS